ncbi:MAG: hypothetical protein L6R30_15950 [Thermoanaerobaculia bacterium]|nr:hypothetical protein [Thermoanaerobaculia bacterium]
MKLESVLRDLEYVRDVAARRSTYHVFRAPQHYLVLSFKSVAAGSFTIVDRAATDLIAAKFAGKTVTNPELSTTTMIPRRFRKEFLILNALYVLVADRRAKINRSLTGESSGAIYFDIKRPTLTDQRKAVARWMKEQLDTADELLQTVAARKIQRQFGRDFVYRDPEGHLAIASAVLYHFRKITNETVVFVTRHGGGYWSGAHWRKRGPGDSRGRTQYEFD